MSGGGHDWGGDDPTASDAMGLGESILDDRVGGMDAGDPLGTIPVSANYRGSGGRLLADRMFRRLCVVVASVAVIVLLVLLTALVVRGGPAVSWDLLTGSPEPDPRQAGLRPAIFGTIWVCVLCGCFTLPVGIATAILLEEFQPRSRTGAWLYGLIRLNISNLAGVPSVVYGILGLTAFVSMFGIFARGDRPGGATAIEFGATYYDQFFSEGERAILVPVDSRSDPIATPHPGMEAYDFHGNRIDVHLLDPGDPLPEDEGRLAFTLYRDSEAGRISNKSWYYLRLPFGRGVMAGALTLMLVILPVIIISAQESLRAVPGSLRDGALGLGATRWQVVWNVTLPSAIPGIMTGSILAMSRAIGETAPILIIAGIVYIRTAPSHLMDDFTVMPLQIYNWTTRPQPEFHDIAAGGILLLLAVLLFFNGLAVLIRHKAHRPLS